VRAASVASAAWSARDGDRDREVPDRDRRGGVPGAGADQGDLAAFIARPGRRVAVLMGVTVPAPSLAT